jgi:hypothetical protein
VPGAAELLAAYDAQRARVSDRLPRGVTVEQDGPLFRWLGLAGRGFVLYRDLGGLEGAELDALIARQVHVFAKRGERFEWKLHGHDRPSDLPLRLRAAGFVPEDTETVEIAPAADIAEDAQLPEGVSLREVTRRPDFRTHRRTRGGGVGARGSAELARRDARVGACRRSGSTDGRRGGGRRDRRLRRLDPLRAQH